MTRLIRLCLVATFFLASSSRVLAAGEADCTGADLKGRYGFMLSGHHTSIGEYALVGVFDVDGREAVKGSGVQSINGNQSRVSFTGTYTVNADCTGSTDLKFGSDLPGKVLFVIVSDGREVLMFDIGGHTVETGIAKTIDSGFAKKQTVTKKKRD